MVLDTDMVARSLRRLALRRLAAWTKGVLRGPAMSYAIGRRVHDGVLARVHFAGGAVAEEIASLIAGAGFADVAVHRDHGAIRHAQARHVCIRSSTEPRKIATRLGWSSESLVQLRGCQSAWGGSKSKAAVCR